MDSNSNHSKIVELVDNDDNSLDEFDDCEERPEDVMVKFKQNFLKNRSNFEKQLLDSTEINPNEIFDFKLPQENEGETKRLHNLMDEQILDCVNVDDEDGKKLLKLSSYMTPLPDCEGVFKKLSSPGEGFCPPYDSIVTIHYNGYVQDEASNQVKSYDSTVLRGKPLTYMRGQEDILPGLDLAVGSMKRKEHAEFIIAPHFAFGEHGCPPRIPPNAYIYFKIDLIDWIDSSAAEAFGKLPLKIRKEMPFEKVIEAAESEKRKGNASFKKEKYSPAISSYLKALRWITAVRCANEEEENLAQELCLILNLNLAQSYLEVNNPKKACIYSQVVLKIKPDHPKALYRYGIAQEKLGNNESAKESLLKAKVVNPTDKSIVKALTKLDAVILNSGSVEKYLAQKMLGLPISKTDNKQSLEPTEASHIAIRRQLIEFVESNEKRITFPQGITQQERKFLEAEANRLKLKFATKPIHTGDTIYTVSK